MNRNYILIIVLLAIAGLAFIVWKTRKDPSTNVDRAESNFKIEDVNTIGRILITDKNGMRNDLKRTGDYWTINDEHRVRQTNIEYLLKGIKEQHLEHIPNREASINILESMAVDGIHVEIFDKAGEKLLGYYVGGVTQDEYGTFFLKEGASQPYSLYEPGFEGALRARYALRAVDWRDVRFWIEDNTRIDTLKVHYPKQRQHSFLIFKEGNDFSIRPLFTTTPRMENPNKVRIESYFTTLSRLACESFLPDSPEKDSILRMVPFMEMQMIYPDSSSHLRFIPGRTVYGEGSTDIPRYYVDYNGRDFMTAQHEVVKGAFTSYESFFE